MTNDPTRARTVTVVLFDGTTVTLPEPPWCVLDHQDGDMLEDFTHDGPTTALTFDAGRRVVTLLEACITRTPHSSIPEHRLTHATVALGGDWYRFDPAGLDRLAAALGQRAEQLRVLGAELAAIVAAEAAR